MQDSGGSIAAVGKGKILLLSMEGTYFETGKKKKGLLICKLRKKPEL